MRHFFILVALVFSWTHALPAQLSRAQRDRVAWVPNPRAANSGWVSDASHHLQPATLDTLNAVIGALEQETSAEIAVAVVDSTSGLEAQEFATALHRAWGVGKSGKDNGVLLLWDPVGRAVFISVGYGLEGAIPDRRAGRIRDEIVGELRQSHFDRGILAGVRALAAAAREEGAPQRQGITRRLEGTDDSSGGASGRAGGVLLWIGGIAGSIAAAIGGIFGFFRWRRYRPRKCSNGHPMRLLTEQQEDDQLDQGARSEERAGSIDWDVWVCKTCKEVTRVPYRKWASPYQECPTCKRRTLSESTRTIEAATTSHGGTETVIDHCGNCGYRSEGTRSTPRIVSGSSRSGGSSSSGGSSGSGGGGFGGGSAGGGGAGGKY